MRRGRRLRARLYGEPTFLRQVWRDCVIAPPRRDQTRYVVIGTSQPGWAGTTLIK